MTELYYPFPSCQARRIKDGETSDAEFEIEKDDGFNEDDGKLAESRSGNGLSHVRCQTIT